MNSQFHLKSLLRPHLIAGILVFTIMTATLGKISQHVTNQRPLTVTDAQFSAWLHTNRSPFVINLMFVATFLGSTVFVTFVTVGMGVYLLRRRRLFWFTALISAVAGGTLLNRALKYLFHRERPYFDDPIVTLTSYSFPSGHTMAASVLFGVLAAYLISRSQNWRQRWLIILSAACLIALVGFSRIYLGAHYLSDVLAAMAEGLAWLSLCFTFIYSVWRRRRN